MDKKIFENAAIIGQKYLDCFNLTGNYNLDDIKKALSKRTHDGKKVKIVVVSCPSEAVKVLKPLMKDNLSPQNCIWDYYYMAFYDAAYSQCPNQDHEFGRQSFYEAFKAGLGYYINLGSFAVAVARPFVSKDPQNRVHKDNGPAIVWGKDKKYFWHGTEVPGDWIEKKDSIDPSLALTHNNIEQRRALCEIIGWTKILAKLDCCTIHKDKYGELIEVNLPDSPKSRFIRVHCATGREFCLPVPNTVKTAKEAVAMTYNVPTSSYDPETRT